MRALRFQPNIMEFAYLVFTAALAGSLAGVCNAILQPALTRLRGQSSALWRPLTFTSQFATLAIYVGAGAAFGAFYWLTWGMAAIVGVPWWLRGALFGLIVWGVACVPLLLTQLLALKLHWSIAIFNAIEWLVTLTIVGVACSWAWQKGV